MAGVPQLPTVEFRAETGSTQDDLLAVAHNVEAWPHLSGIRAGRQHAGRGRRGRVWQTDDLRALMVSLVLRPQTPPSTLPWMSMLTGAALVDVVSALGGTASLKWPNDVLLHAVDDVPGWGRWRKVAGILATGLPDGGGVVVGIGVNLAGQVPVPWATTLAEAGIDVEAQALLDLLRAQLVRALATDVADWPDAIGQRCATVGARARADLPDGTSVTGLVVGLGAGGGLLLVDDGGTHHELLAAQIEHLRTQPGPAGGNVTA